MKQTFFFRVIAWITFSLSCYSWWLLYNQHSWWWIGLGLNLVVTMFALIFGVTGLRRILSIPGLSLRVLDFLLIASALGYFVSALVGFMIIILQLPINDSSFMIFPLIIVVFIFGGATLGVYQDHS